MKLTDTDLKALQIAVSFEPEVFRFDDFGKALYPDMKFRRRNMPQGRRLSAERVLRRLHEARLIILTPFGYDGEHRLALTSAGKLTLKHGGD